MFFYQEKNNFIYSKMWSEIVFQQPQKSQMPFSIF